MAKLSVITSMYNRSTEVLSAIDNLFFPSLLNNGNSGTEVIIIDDCSPLENETKAIVEKYLPDLKRRFGNVDFIRNASNLGFAKSFNKGLILAGGEKSVVVNDDLYFPQNSLAGLAATLDEPEGYLIAGPITNASSSWSYQYCKQAPQLESYALAEIEKLERFARWLLMVMKGRRMTTDNLCGFCFAADAVFLKKIGGFNERYGYYGFFEDTDLVQRIARECGEKKIAVNLEVFIGHGGVKGTSRTMLQQPLKMACALLVNGFKYANDWGYGKLLKRIIYGNWSQLTGKGTISELLPKKIDL
jgi:GT2 family glycosyltransferase